MTKPKCRSNRSRAEEHIDSHGFPTMMPDWSIASSSLYPQAFRRQNSVQLKSVVYRLTQADSKATTAPEPDAGCQSRTRRREGRTGVHSWMRRPEGCSPRRPRCSSTARNCCGICAPHHTNRRQNKRSLDTSSLQNDMSLDISSRQSERSLDINSLRNGRIRYMLCLV